MVKLLVWMWKKYFDTVLQVTNHSGIQSWVSFSQITVITIIHDSIVHQDHAFLWLLIQNVSDLESLFSGLMNQLHQLHSSLCLFHWFQCFVFLSVNSSHRQKKRNKKKRGQWRGGTRHSSILGFTLIPFPSSFCHIHTNRSDWWIHARYLLSRFLVCVSFFEGWLKLFKLKSFSFRYEITQQSGVWITQVKERRQ